MQFVLAAFTGLSSLLASQYALAAPATELAHQNLTTSSVAPSEANIFICTDSYFNGNCGSFKVGVNECFTFPTAFQKDVSSLVLFNGASWGCEAYVDVACFADQGNLFFSVAQVDLGNTNFNDKLSSVICSYTPAS